MLRHLPPSPFPLSTWAGIFSLQRLEVLGWVCQQLALLKKLSKILFLISINIKDSLIVFGWEVSANKEKKMAAGVKNFLEWKSHFEPQRSTPLYFLTICFLLCTFSLSLSLSISLFAIFWGNCWFLTSSTSPSFMAHIGHTKILHYSFPSISCIILSSLFLL